MNRYPTHAEDTMELLREQLAKGAIDRRRFLQFSAMIGGTWWSVCRLLLSLAVLSSIVFALLAIRGRAPRFLLLDALLMIIVTGIVYNAILAPAGSPRDAVNRLSAEAKRSVQMADAKEKFAAMAIEVVLAAMLLLGIQVSAAAWLSFAYLLIAAAASLAHGCPAQEGEHNACAE